MSARMRHDMGLIVSRSVVLGALVLSGCGVGARATECAEVTRTLTLPKPAKSKTSSATLLSAAAKEFDEASTRAKALTNLRPELAPIAAEAATHFATFAKELRSAARARKAERAPDYAAARQRTDEIRRAMTALAQRFDAICGR
jgi:hypothetical protein